MSVTVKVKVPGTTANCGPGFDAVGIACSIYNELELTLCMENTLIVEVEGEGKGLIKASEQNIVVKAVRAVLTKVGSAYQGIKIKMYNNIPLARGLGSSAAAIVAGLVAANAATGSKLSKHDILDLATKMEGHPDNVAPAIFGGITISIMEGEHAKSLRFVPPNKLSLVVAIPEFKLSTHDARMVLPKTVPFKDAVFNISRATLLIGSLCSGDFSYLGSALEDKIHHPYRESLIPGMKTVFEAAARAGAFGSAISGAGPCLIAFAQENTEQIGSAMVEAFAANNIKSVYKVFSIDTDGAQVLA